LVRDGDGVGVCHDVGLVVSVRWQSIDQLMISLFDG
jgi:hypothetical protein